MRLTPVPEPSPRLADIDLCDPVTFAHGSLHPAWLRLRREAPMWRQCTPSGTPFWSATRYRDVAAILMDDKAFSSENGTILAVADGDPAGGKTINLSTDEATRYPRVPPNERSLEKTVAISFPDISVVTLVTGDPAFLTRLERLQTQTAGSMNPGLPGDVLGGGVGDHERP